MGVERSSRKNGEVVFNWALHTEQSAFGSLLFPLMMVCNLRISTKVNDTFDQSTINIYLCTFETIGEFMLCLTMVIMVSVCVAVTNS